MQRRQWIALFLGLALLFSTRSIFMLLGAFPHQSIEGLGHPEYFLPEDRDDLLSSGTDTTVVVAYCRENLAYLDYFGPCSDHGLQFVIMSKCNATVPTFYNISECATIVEGVENCGTQEYAYFKFIDDHYDALPAMVAFIQGGALTENPHLLHDIMHIIPGTYYADLSRHVLEAWHMGSDPVRSSMIRQVAPRILHEKFWWASWRSQFMVSRRALQRFPRQLYQEFNQKFCSQTCKEINCGTEVYFSAMFGCTDSVFRGPECTQHKHYLYPMLIPEDLTKDALFYDNMKYETFASSTLQTTCGTKTMLVAESIINGRLVCVEQQGVRRRLTWWRSAIYQLYAETKLPRLDNLEWRWQRKCEKVILKHSEWRLNPRPTVKILT
jgi:hypothetical protein